jgi:hypothetical protein
MKISPVWSIQVEDLLSKFRQDDAIDTPTARFTTRVPSVAPEGYLNIVFKPLSEALVRSAVEELECPQAVERFLRTYNGLRLFFDEFCVYGLVDDNEPIDRTSLLGQRPISLRRKISECENIPGWTRNLFPIGWYGADGSTAFIQRSDGKVRCFYGKNLNRERNFWTDFPTFLSTEIERISALYSPEGIRSCPDEFTLPTRSN